VRPRAGVRSLAARRPDDLTAARRDGGQPGRGRLNTTGRREGMSEQGLSRRDVFVTGGLAAAGAALLGTPAATAAVNRSTRRPKSMRIAVITHGAGDAFWAVAHKGASAAGSDLGITVLYSESANDAQKQAQLIDTAVSQKVKGIATSLPDPSAMQDSLGRAKSAGIPLITLNSGL